MQVFSSTIFFGHYIVRRRYIASALQRCIGIAITLYLGATLAAPSDTIAFFYALDADLNALKSQATPIGQSVTVGSRSIQHLTLGVHDLYAVKMGSGCVETAVSAQALMSRFRCDWALSIGPAGALDDALEIGQWIRVTNVVANQKGVVGADGFHLSDQSSWALNAELFPLPDDGTAKTSPLITVTSGETFIVAERERNRLRALTGATAVDMNTFGLAVVCADHRVPLLVWRVISDRANEEAPEAFRRFVTTYDGRGGRIAAAWIAQLPSNPDNPESYPDIMKFLPATSLDEE